MSSFKVSLINGETVKPYVWKCFHSIFLRLLHFVVHPRPTRAFHIKAIIEDTKLVIVFAILKQLSTLTHFFPDKIICQSVHDDVIHEVP